MHDLLPYAAEKLKAGGYSPELSYNGISAKLPAVVLSEVSNTAASVTDNAEWLSRVTVQIDVYAETDKAARENALNISNIMTAGGFYRSSFLSVRENELKRIMLQFSCSVDSKNRIYGAVTS